MIKFVLYIRKFANILINKSEKMDYKKKSLKKLDLSNDYEEIDTRIASGWYVDSLNKSKKKSYKTSQVMYKISKNKT